VVMGAKAPTATAVKDTDNSPRFIQQKTGTAAGRCWQPFSIVRQLLVAVGDNPILQPTHPCFFFLLIPSI
jgi:hypothetical protein